MKLKIEIIEKVKEQLDLEEQLKKATEANDKINQKVEDDKSTVVYLPVKPKQKLVAFIQAINNQFEGFPSNGIKIDTADFTVVHNSRKYTIDEYFQNYVSDFSSYLTGLISETTIPFS